MNRTDFEPFIRKYGKEIYSFCCWLTGNRQEADDLFQDTFVEALEKESELPSAESDTEIKKLLLFYCARIWKNRKQKFARRRRIAEERYFPEEQVEETDRFFELPEEYVLKQEKRTLVWEFVNQLPAQKKLILLLCYREDMSMEEIAGMLKLPVGTVKSTLFRTKKQLAAQLSGYEGTDALTGQERSAK